MIDIHCHILPNMDDGSDSLEESLNMIRVAQKNDTNVIIATPHFYKYDSIDEFVFERDEKALLLNNAAKELGYNVSVACGAEVFLDSRIFTADNLDELTLNGSKYLLCEFTLKPFENEKAVIYCEELVSRGYVPIIAHPERYINFLNDPTVVNDLWDMGCKFQVNASGLAGHGGERMQDFACELIKRGFCVAIGTDAHSSNLRNNRILDKTDEFPEEITEEDIEEQLNANPLRILKKEDLPEKEVEYF